jgi:hypothetical protein
LTVGPPVFDRHVLARDIAGLFQALTKAAQAIRDHLSRSVVEESDHRHRRLLRARRERPRGRAAEQRDELAPSHCLPQDRDQPHSTYAIKAGFCDQRYGRKCQFALQKS